MDPLALLSNLHGDGPATLQRLRRHGCDTLACVLGSPAEELAQILGWEPVRTERFLREAEVLMRRLGDGLLDVEEDAPEPVAPEPRRMLHVLDDADDELEELEATLEDNEQAMIAAATDFQEAARLAAVHEALEARQAELYAEWETLEALVSDTMPKTQG